MFFFLLELVNLQQPMFLKSYIFLTVYKNNVSAKLNFFLMSLTCRCLCMYMYTLVLVVINWNLFSKLDNLNVYVVLLLLLEVYSASSISSNKAGTDMASVLQERLSKVAKDEVPGKKISTCPFKSSECLTFYIKYKQFVILYSLVLCRVDVCDILKHLPLIFHYLKCECFCFNNCYCIYAHSDAPRGHMY